MKCKNCGSENINIVPKTNMIYGDEIVIVNEYICNGCNCSWQETRHITESNSGNNILLG